MAKLHQLNIRFDSLEDRLTLGIMTNDGNEFLLWLTRRYTKLLLEILDKLANPNRSKEAPSEQTAEIKKAVMIFQRDAALADLESAAEFESGEAEHPLGETPLLVSRIQFKKRPPKEVLFSFGLPDGRDISINLNEELLLALMKVVEDGAKKAEWDLVNTSLEMEDIPYTHPADMSLH